MKATDLKSFVPVVLPGALETKTVEGSPLAPAKKLDGLPPEDAPLGSGLQHHVSGESTTATEEGSALSLRVEQSKTEAQHRRGRTAALKVVDAKDGFGVQERKAFKPLVELIGPLQELMTELKERA